MRTRTVARLRLSLADDGSSAEVLVTAGPPATRRDLDALLAGAGVVTGLDHEALAALAARLADETFEGEAIVARGRTPRPGTPGRIELAYQPGLRAGLVSANGCIDFHERSMLASVRAGDLVATIVPPEPGVAGFDVRGRVLPVAPVAPAVVHLGRGVRRYPDGRVVAAIDGVVLCGAGGTIDVVPLWMHDTDVDLRSGNLRIHGTLIVHGDVTSGFTATATGDVIVHGMIDGVVEAGGSVMVGCAVQGGSRVWAAGDLTCRHATAAVLHAGGTVSVDDQAANCSIRAAAVELTRGHGQIMGGEVRARRCIRALVAGTAAGVRTVLAIDGLLPALFALERSEPAPPPMVFSPRFTKPSVMLPLPTDAEVAQRIALLGHREKIRGARIQVRDRIHPGVCIRIGPAELEVSEPLPGGTFRFDEETGTVRRDEA